MRGIIGLLWGIHLALVGRFFYLCDDAFISFRYARNWAEGHGLRYNLTGEPPVEGFSNFLWVVLAAAAELVGIEALAVLPVVSVLCASVLMARVVAVMQGPMALRPPAVLMGLAFLALSPAVALWSSSGLETMPAALLMFVSVELLLLSPRRDAGVWGGLAALGLGLIRAEGFVWVGVLLLLTLLHPQRRQHFGAAAVIAAGGLGVALIGRLWWFGQWMPNTVTAKVGFSGATILRGLRYAGAVHLTLLAPPLALLGARVMVARQGLATGGAVVLLAAAGLAWPVAVGGDFMPMGRLFVVALPLLALLWGAALEGARPAVMIGAGAVMIGGAVSAADLHPVPDAVRAALNYRYTMDYRSELQSWVIERDQVAVLSQVGTALAQHTRPDETVVVGALGAVGYYSARPMLDRFGLITPLVARRAISADELTRPGHDKAVDNYYFVENGLEPGVLFARIVSGPDLFAQTRGYAADLLQRELQNRYAPRLEPIAGTEAHLFLLQRIPPGQSPSALWSSWRMASGAP